jgi:hypothetical protein
MEPQNVCQITNFINQTSAPLKYGGIDIASESQSIKY